MSVFDTFEDGHIHTHENTYTYIPFAMQCMDMNGIAMEYHRSSVFCASRTRRYESLCSVSADKSITKGLASRCKR